MDIMTRASFGATARDLHIDQTLSNFAIGYRPSGMIADQIMPIVPVGKQSNHYAIFSREDRLRIEDTKRSPGREANMIEQSVSSDTYFAENYALKAPVTVEDRENADPIYFQEIVEGRVTLVVDKLHLDWENRVAGLVNSTSNVGSSAAVNSAWNGSGDVLGDINTGIDNVQDLTGIRPNQLTLGLDAWKSARRDETVRNLIFGTNNGGGYVGRQQFAELFEIDSLNIGGAYKNTANEAQAESLTKIWADNVLISYTAERPSAEVPTFAASFRWRVPGIPNMQVERHPFDSKRKSEEVEVGYYQSEKITGSVYAFLLTAVNSST